MVAQKLSPDVPINGLEGATVGDYWSWAYSDILCNANRSILAEFVVGKVLGVVDTPRIEWDAYDLLYGTKKIEVKCAAYIQSWDADDKVKLSAIRFDIAKKFFWDARTNVNAGEAARAADLYVFCLYPETDRKLVNILDLGAWEFYVVSKDEIDKRFGEQKSIGLTGLRAFCDPVRINGLRKTVDEMLSSG